MFVGFVGGGGDDFGKYLVLKPGILGTAFDAAAATAGEIRERFVYVKIHCYLHSKAMKQMMKTISIVANCAIVLGVRSHYALCSGS